MAHVYKPKIKQEITENLLNKMENVFNKYFPQGKVKGLATESSVDDYYYDNHGNDALDYRIVLDCDDKDEREYGYKRFSTELLQDIDPDDLQDVVDLFGNIPLLLHIAKKSLKRE